MDARIDLSDVNHHMICEWCAIHMTYIGFIGMGFALPKTVPTPRPFMA